MPPSSLLNDTADDIMIQQSVIKELEKQNKISYCSGARCY